MSWTLLNMVQKFIVLKYNKKGLTMPRGRYYLGRVIKLGRLDQNMLMNAIAEAPTVSIGKFAWTITDIKDNRNNKTPFIFGRLSKFSREGHVKIVDTSSKSQVDALAENLLRIFCKRIK